MTGSKSIAVLRPVNHVGGCSGMSPGAPSGSRSLMRVLLAADWTAERGGVETYLEQLRGGLRAAGVETRLLASSVGEGAHLADYVAPGSDRAIVQAVSQLVNPAAMIAVRSAVKDFRPDVVHLSGFELQLSPAVFAALGGTPAVVNVAWTKPICPTGHKLLPDRTLCGQRWGTACRDHGCVRGLRWVARWPDTGPSQRRSAPPRRS